MAVRKRILVSGTVQGVGFRPAVARLALSSGLSGWVANSRGGAVLEIQGPEPAVGEFIRDFRGGLPVNARVERISVEDLPPRDERGFEIRASLVEGQTRFSVPPDIAMCPACRREFDDPGDRRYRHAFISCGDCGPRYTYIVDLPYDRSRTTMASFPMCPACAAEYEDPRDRRYHIEGFCCPACGPRLSGLAKGLEILRAGGIVAIKGIGGYHLACLADEAEAVATLRRRKDRPYKPFAVMFPSLEELEARASLLDGERGVLLSPEAPILLLPKARFGHPPLELLAPDNPALGVFLPYSPIHLLVLSEIGAPLVMTSANMPGDPLVIDDEAALEGLSGVVDGWIRHDRKIQSRADDGVVLLQVAGPTRIRNGRGSFPRPYRLDRPSPRGILAVGAQLKSTVTVVSGGDLAASPHIGDLENEPTFESFRRAAEGMLEYFGVEPGIVAADLHPDYESTRYAKELARGRSIPLVQVQHHYAHLLAVLFDLGLIGGAQARDGPFLGIILDGTGYGEDGTIWGGEILVGDAAGFERAAHLSHLRLPGGEAAIRDPVRILAAEDLAPEGRLSDSDLERIAAIAANPRLSPPTSSCGRLFDAAAAILGFERRVSFEGEAAIWLESLAAEAGEMPASGPGRRLCEREFPAMDGRGLLRALRDEVPDARRTERAALASLARGFHRSLARNIAREAARIASERALDEAFLSGGVYQNRIFTGDLVSELVERGLAARLGAGIPPNDACISVGQAVFALGAENAILK